MILQLLPLFIATYISAVYLRKKEILSAIALFVILITIIIISKFSVYESIIIIILGFIMAFAEWTCITYFNMWKYNYSQYTVPLWLPFAWSISMVFGYHFIKFKIY